MSWMDAEVDKGKMPGGSGCVLGCRGGRLAAFRLFWTGWAKSLAEIRVFSKWLAENGALNDCFPPFFAREIAIHLRLYVKPPFIGVGLTPPGGAHRLHELPQRGGRTHVC